MEVNARYHMYAEMSPPLYSAYLITTDEDPRLGRNVWNTTLDVLQLT